MSSLFFSFHLTFCMSLSPAWVMGRCGRGQQRGSSREWERVGRIYPNTVDVCDTTKGLHYGHHGRIQPLAYTTSCYNGPKGTAHKHTLCTHYLPVILIYFFALMFFFFPTTGFGCAVDYYTVPSSEATACTSYAGREVESGAFCTNVWHRAHPHCQQPQPALRQPTAPLLHTLLSEGTKLI